MNQLTGLAQSKVVRITPMRGVTVMIFAVNLGKNSFSSTGVNERGKCQQRIPFLVYNPFLRQLFRFNSHLVIGLRDGPSYVPHQTFTNRPQYIDINYNKSIINGEG